MVNISRLDDGWKCLPHPAPPQPASQSLSICVSTPPPRRFSCIDKPTCHTPHHFITGILCPVCCPWLLNTCCESLCINISCVFSTTQNSNDGYTIIILEIVVFYHKICQVLDFFLYLRELYILSSTFCAFLKPVKILFCFFSRHFISSLLRSSCG